MPTPFHLSGGIGNSNSSTNVSNVSSAHTTTTTTSSSYEVQIEREDPSKIFTELTEIGHGNFGAVYFVISYLTRAFV